MPEEIRVDKWLWHVRIFKSRTQASNACRSGKIKIEDSSIKPSYKIKVDDILTVKKEGFELIFKVVAIIKKRVSATLAQPCYENLTSEEELNKFKSWFIGKAPAEKREKGTGRPTKKERREISSFKEEYIFDFEEEE